MSGLDGAGTQRPLLLLDVDGVLLVWRGAAWTDGLDDDVGFHPDAPGWLTQLARHFDPVWATTWEDQANRAIGPGLGLPPLPYIEFEMDHRARTPKLHSVAAWVGDRACAWIDDDLHPDADAWAAGRPAPTLLVHIDAAEGMVRRHVDELLDWATSLRGTGSR